MQGLGSGDFHLLSVAQFPRLPERGVMAKVGVRARIWICDSVGLRRVTEGLPLQLQSTIMVTMRRV